jgi:hypothetical protein
VYGKIFASLFEGSMYGAGCDVFAVWAYVIANADAKGFIEINPLKLANTLGADKQRVELALEYLCQPDPSSRNPDDEGRRLVREGAFMYRVVSHHHYRDMRNMDAKREYDRSYRRERRANPLDSQVVATTKTTNAKSSQSSGDSPQVEAEAEAKAEVKAEIQKPLAPSAPKSRSKPAPGFVEPDQIAGTLPLIDGTDYEISKQQVADWREAYPAIDVRQQLLAMKEWLKANPANRKTRQGANKFVVGWLKREQDKAPRRETTSDNRHSATHERVMRNKAALAAAAAKRLGLQPTGGAAFPDAGPLPFARLDGCDGGLSVGLRAPSAAVLPFGSERDARRVAHQAGGELLPPTG